MLAKTGQPASVVQAYVGELHAPMGEQHAAHLALAVSTSNSQPQWEAAALVGWLALLAGTGRAPTADAAPPMTCDRPGPKAEADAVLLTFTASQHHTHASQVTHGRRMELKVLLVVHALLVVSPSFHQPTPAGDLNSKSKLAHGVLQAPNVFFESFWILISRPCLLPPKIQKFSKFSVTSNL